MITIFNSLAVWNVDVAAGVGTYNTYNTNIIIVLVIISCFFAGLFRRRDTNLVMYDGAVYATVGR